MYIMLRKSIVFILCCLLLCVSVIGVTGAGVATNSAELASDSSQVLSSTTDEIRITVNDSSNGNDTAVEDITIQQESDVSTYTNNNNVVESGNLNNAFSDWQAGDIDSGVLNAVFSAWQSGEPVN